MSKIDDTFEMLDNTPEGPKKSIILLILIGLLVVGGMSALAQKQMADKPTALPTMGESVNKETASSPDTAATGDSSAVNESPAVTPPLLTPIETVINFGEASAALRPDQLAKLETFYQEIKDTPGTLHISGYTDDVGPDDGMALSIQRAKAVAESLIVLQNDPEVELVVEGFGDDSPVGDNSTALGRQQNRRVELKFYTQGQAYDPESVSR